MITDSIRCVAILLVLFSGTTGCVGLSGRACLQRQQRGNVFSVSGKIDPGGSAVHKVVYGTEGSQNNIKITWSGQRSSSGPRLRVYATRAECTDASEVGNSGTIYIFRGESPPPCAIIGRVGGFSVEGEFVQGDLIIANGRGNPDILGSPAEYKLWVFGDPYKRALYTIAGSYFFGPDC